MLIRISIFILHSLIVENALKIRVQLSLSAFWRDTQVAIRDTLAKGIAPEKVA